MDFEFLKKIQLNANSRVVIETAPIYLCDEPNIFHTKSDFIANNIYSQLQALGCKIDFFLLLDEYSCNEKQGNRKKYKDLLTLVPTQIILESELVGPATELKKYIPNRFTVRGGKQGNFLRLKRNPSPVLVKDNGLPACALLDSAFQLSKHCDLNIIIHPEKMFIEDKEVSFVEQQRGVLSVLQSIRNQNSSQFAQLPWSKGLIHIWLDSRAEISRIIWIRNKGRGIKASSLSTTQIFAYEFSCV